MVNKCFSCVAFVKGFSVSWKDYVIHGDQVIRGECRKVSVLSLLLVVNKVNFSSYTQGCKFSGNCLNSGLHEAEIPALLFIFSPFWRLLAQIHALFQAFSLRSAYIPDIMPTALSSEDSNVLIMCKFTCHRTKKIKEHLEIYYFNYTMWHILTIVFQLQGCSLATAKL